MPSPRQTFEDNIRPAELLLRVFRLLDTNDQFLTGGQLVESLRGVVKASKDEDLLVVYNELFLGLVREGAQVPRSTLRRTTLNHLLRQAVVASCTGLDTYLPALLRTNLPTVIRAVGRDFYPREDSAINEYFIELNFSVDETLRLISDPNAAEYISQKILNLAKFNYLSNKKGVYVVGRLLGLSKPWDQLASHLAREKKDLISMLEAAVNRRNNIVHRADREPDHEDADPQDISYAWTLQAVGTIQSLCMALDELVEDKMKEYQSVLAQG